LPIRHMRLQGFTDIVEVLFKGDFVHLRSDQIKLTEV